MPKTRKKPSPPPSALNDTTTQANQRLWELDEEDYPDISFKRSIRKAKKCHNEREAKKRELKEALAKKRFFEETISSQKEDIQRLKDLLMEESVKNDLSEGTISFQRDEIQCLKNLLKEKCIKETNLEQVNRSQMEEIQRLKEELNRNNLYNIVERL